MLYLNWTCFQPLAGLDTYLTLTNVVFEFLFYIRIDIYIFDLTLTNVVFESKSCGCLNKNKHNLTLTNVVFELYIAG